MSGAALVWFFGYGSLMWRPGFEAAACEPAGLDGWRRSLCILSTHYRGTPARPGLVLGLQPGGGRCVGRAFGVGPAHAEEVLRYLDARELLDSYVYARRSLAVTLLDTGQAVDAWCYVAKPEHADYRGGLPTAEVVRHVREGHGLSGSNRDYLRATVTHLADLGIAEPELDAVLRALDEPEAVSPRPGPAAGPP